MRRIVICLVAGFLLAVFVAVMGPAEAAAQVNDTATLQSQGSPHLHLLLNHFPTIGTLIGLGLFIVSLVVKSDHLKRASLGVFVFIALMAVPAYMSGNAAQTAIQGNPNVSTTRTEMHRDAALLAVVLMELTGAIAWLALWQFRQVSGPTRFNLAAVLILSIVSAGLMANAANIGGEIRHTEIRSIQGTTSDEEAAIAETKWLKSASIVAGFVTYYPWVWPAAEVLHFTGLCLLFGVVLMINLRMLGMFKGVSMVALHRLLPWGILGLGINFVTGMLFFITTPVQYTQNIAFYWKMGFMLLAGYNLLCLTSFDEFWVLGPEERAPITIKLFAATSIFLWTGVIYFGRMLPYIGSE